MPGLLYTVADAGADLTKGAETQADGLAPLLKNADETVAKAVGSALMTVPGGGLAAHESVGGHTLAKHVGKSDADLAARLAAEPRIKAASSFTDLATAERATADALQAKSADIAIWLTGTQKRMPAVEVNVGYHVGRSLHRGAASASDVLSVRIVLERHPALPTGYRVITAFPAP